MQREWAWRAAKCRAVKPLPARASTSAPCRTRTLSVSIESLSAAHCSGVVRVPPVRALASAPALSSL